MPHTPPVPKHIPCPDSCCGRIFMHPKDLKVHTHVHNIEREELKLKCPRNGCSFKTLQLKRLEAHVDAAHTDQPRQFQCLQDHCGFSTTNQGALTRHYRERHHMEPPTSIRKPRQRASRKLRSEQLVASTSRLSESPISSISRFSSAEPPFSATSTASSASMSPSVISTTLTPEMNKYYPATAHYPPSPPASTAPTSPYLDSISVHLAAGGTKLNTGTSKLYAPCPPAGPQNHWCVDTPGYTSPPRLSTPRASSNLPPSPTEWVSWRDECDVSLDLIAVATGEQAFSEQSMSMGMTEYLRVPAAIGMAEKRLLWA
ncbi:hypothetical protein B0H19DRAFT_1158731 [Mycena capillaripes]|nr:hypothetical protein B0H19DRAFT_1158731 [Mycena capillaripes]